MPVAALLLGAASTGMAVTATQQGTKLAGTGGSSSSMTS